MENTNETVSKAVEVVVENVIASADKKKAANFSVKK